MDYQEVREAVERRLVVGVALAVVLGVLGSVLGAPFLDWYFGMQPSKVTQEYQGAIEFFSVNWGHSMVAFGLFYLLPALLVDAVAGWGRRGLLGVAVFHLSWFATAVALQHPSFLTAWLSRSLAIVVVFEFAMWIYGGGAERDKELGESRPRIFQE